MKRSDHIHDRDIELLLAGQAPEGEPELAELACFFTEVDSAFPETSTERFETQHVAAMLAAARGAAGAETDKDPSDVPTARRSSVGSRVWANKWARLAIVTAAAVLAFGGLAFAAVLPAPVQDAVAGAAQQVGIPVPDSSGLTGLQAGQESDDESETVEPADVEDQNEDIDDADEVEAPDTDEDALEAPEVDEQDDADDEDAPRTAAPRTAAPRPGGSEESGESDD